MSGEPNPIIYVGQSACMLGEAIHKLNQSFHYSNIPSLFVTEEIQLVRPTPQKKSAGGNTTKTTPVPQNSPLKIRHESKVRFHLLKCSHPILEPAIHHTTPFNSTNTTQQSSDALRSTTASSS